MASLIRGRDENDELCWKFKIRVGPKKMKMMMMVMILCLCLTGSSEEDGEPKPKTWPEQFHSILVINNTKTQELQVVDLWYDWPNGRNLNLIQHQLGKLLYDVEYNNGTSYYFTLGSGGECRTIHFDVGILRPNWLDGGVYLGQKHIHGFLCNVWMKADFIVYYEDVETRRPVYWLFYTGREVHVMTFEVGAVLVDSQWQAPVHCFSNENTTLLHSYDNHSHSMRDYPIPLSVI